MGSDPKYNIVSMRVTDNELKMLQSFKGRRSMSDTLRAIVFKEGKLDGTPTDEN